MGKEDTELLIISSTMFLYYITLYVHRLPFTVMTHKNIITGYIMVEGIIREYLYTSRWLYSYGYEGDICLTLK